LPGGLFLGASFHATEKNRQAIRLGQTLHFLVEDEQQLAGAEFVQWIGRRASWCFPEAAGLALPATGFRAAAPRGEAVSGPVQPGGQSVRAADLGGLPREHQEGGLGRVLGLMHIAQDAAADA